MNTIAKYIRFWLAAVQIRCGRRRIVNGNELEFRRRLFHRLIPVFDLCEPEFPENSLFFDDGRWQTTPGATDEEISDCAFLNTHKRPGYQAIIEKYGLSDEYKPSVVSVRSA